MNRQTTAVRGTQGTNFRPDINGLRAWSVAAVIGYHFGLPGFDGGFVGVDVFFVISGYLMTGIIVDALQAGRLNLLQFYLARAKRIVPALAVLCAVVTLIGWFFLLPPDLRTLGTHVVAAMGFFSNIKFWDEAGYFDDASHEKWLLHTWSLSVEWQFYLLLPVLLRAAWRWRPGLPTVTGVLLLCAAASLAASLLVTPDQPSTAFYWLHTRAWELFAGGLVYLAGRRVPASMAFAVHTMGLAAVVVSVLVFNSRSAWPGVNALLPVAGAAMVLAAQARSTLTDSAPMQWMGLRSYSLYLWHWPVYVGLAYFGLQHDAALLGAGLALTVVLAEMSYRYVETPARQRLGKGRQRPLLLLAVAVVPLWAAGLVLWRLDGVQGRFPPAVELAAAEAGNVNPRREACYQRQGVESPSCVYGGTEWKVIGLGDSHMAALITGLEAGQTDGPAGVVQWSYRGCLFVPGLKRLHAPADGIDECSGFIQWALAQLESLPRALPVVLTGRYAHAALGGNEDHLQRETPQVYFSSPQPQPTPAFLAEFAARITDTACTLAQHRTTYLVRPIPEMGFNVPRTLSRRMMLGRNEDLSVPLSDYMRRNAWVWAAQDAARERCGVRILDPLPYLCQEGRCYGSRNGRPLYTDDDHLSEFGNKLLAPMFAAVFRDSAP